MKFIRRLLFKFFPNKMYSREVKKLEEFYNPKISKAKGLDRSNLIAERDFEISIVYYEWQYEKNEQIIQNAIKYDLDIPTKPTKYEANESWRFSSIGYLLTDKARKQLKKEIRAEKEYRRNSWAFYVGSLTGVLGLVVSIIALLKG